MWHKAVQYLKKMGGIILITSIIIWSMGYFPLNIEYSHNYENQIKQIKANSYATDSVKKTKIAEIEFIWNSGKMEKSYIGQLGHFIEPVIRPLGFD